MTAYPCTLTQQRAGVKCHAGACAIRWTNAHAPRSLQARLARQRRAALQPRDWRGRWRVEADRG